MYGLIDSLAISYNGNQRSSVVDGISNLSYSGSSEFVRNGTGGYAYNTNGALRSDENRGIDSIEYDMLGNPKKIRFTGDRSIEYVYAASGEKLREIHKRPRFTLGVLSLGSPPPLHDFYICDTTDYLGPLILRNGHPEMFRFDGGYVSFENDTISGIHYYIQDYMGNNRMVVNRDGTVEQVTHYYPYGGVIGDISTNESLQKFKFEGKELDRTFGLDNYDIHARSYFAMAPMWDRPDKLAEKYYHLSPYVFARANPINFGDYDGKDYWSTSDPDAIRNFMMYGSYTGEKWTHLTDDEFSSNLFYNDETDKYYLSYGTVENGEIVCHGSSFLWPLSRDYTSFLSSDNSSISTLGSNSSSSRLIGNVLFGLGEVTSYGEPAAKFYRDANLYTYHTNNGKLVNSTKPSYYISKFRAQSAGRIAKGLSVGSYGIGIVSIGFTIEDILYGDKKFWGEGGVDIGMTMLGYWWPYGTIASTIYFGYQCYSE